MESSTRKILVVDDLEDWREMIGGLLRDAGYRVSVADSTINAIQAIYNNKFDLAVIDVRLNDADEDNKDGLDLAAKIKRQQPNIKIIIMTGYGTQDIMRVAMQPNERKERLADDYIAKIETETLIDRIQEIFSKR